MDWESTKIRNVPLSASSKRAPSLVAVWRNASVFTVNYRCKTMSAEMIDTLANRRGMTF